MRFDAAESHHWIDRLLRGNVVFIIDREEKEKQVMISALNHD